MNRQSRWMLYVGCLVLGAIGGFWANEQRNAIAQPQMRAIPEIPRELTSYRSIVKDAVPAVVSIESKVRTKVLRGRNGEEFALPGSGVPLGFGSGFIVDPKGIILTNYHVVEGGDTVEIRLQDGRKFLSKTILSDRKTDLAVVKVETDKPLPFLVLGDSDAVEVGDRVLAVGAPFGLTGSVTHGIISAKSRNLRLNQYEDFLQTDAAINPGNSGGPLISLDGRVIGINSAIKSRSGGFQGVGLAISSKLAKSVMEQLLKEGTVRRGYIGVKLRDLDEPLAQRLGVKENSGVMITGIYHDSPAARAGILPGDIVTAIAGKAVRDGEELQKLIGTFAVRQEVVIDLLRDGKPMQARLVIGEQPENFGLTDPWILD